MVRQRFAKPYRGNKPLRGFESRTLRLRPDLIGAAADSVRNFGGVREWFIRAVLKTVVLLCRTVGSNPTPTAILPKLTPRLFWLRLFLKLFLLPS